MTGLQEICSPHLTHQHPTRYRPDVLNLPVTVLALHLESSMKLRTALFSASPAVPEEVDVGLSELRDRTC